MKRGKLKAKASDYAVAATIQSGKAISPEVFLPHNLRPRKAEPTAIEYEARARSAGITKEANW